jgi:hypothetical protein
MAYTTQYGLPQNVVNYLNQQLPTADIYGGITSVPFTFDDVAAEQQIESQASGNLTPEQLKLLYLQQQGGGEGRDEIDNLNRIDNNAGIYSMKDLVNTFKSTPTAAKIGGLAFGPLGFIGGLIGTNIADKFGFTQAGRDRIARETAAQRGADKQKIENLKNFNQNYKSYFSGDSGNNNSNNNQGGGTFGDSVNDAGSFSDYS